MKQFIADAFTDKPFPENPAAVRVTDGRIREKSAAISVMLTGTDLNVTPPLLRKAFRQAETGINPRSRLSQTGRGFFIFSGFGFFRKSYSFQICGAVRTVVPVRIASSIM